MNDLLKCKEDYIEFTNNIDSSNKVLTDKAPLIFFILVLF